MLSKVERQNESGQHTGLRSQCMILEMTTYGFEVTVYDTRDDNIQV